MAAAPAPDAEWVTDANESFHLSLVRPKEDKACLTAREVYEGFNPTFTYPVRVAHPPPNDPVLNRAVSPAQIFGEDEKFYGYKDLVVDLKFASGSLAQYVKISYADKLPSSSAVDNIEDTLAQFIPPGYYKSEAEFTKRVEEDATTFKPYGTLIHSYSRSARKMSSGRKNASLPQPVYNPNDDEIVEFEVYHAKWDTPGFREYHRRMQIFILLYIEGGSYIEEGEDAWEFVVLYEKRRRRSSPDVVTYHFVGYSTLYPFYCFPEKTRMRLSQFVILPPYQQEGHGSALYASIYQYIVSEPTIAELTVEDPAEPFEDLRDRNDLKMLLNNERFMREALGDDFTNSGRASPAHHPSPLLNGNGHNGHGGGGGGGGRVARSRTTHHERSVPLGSNGHGGAGASARRKTLGKMGPPVDRKWMEKWRVELKIAQRQFNRLIEMLILKHMNHADGPAFKQYRLQVKQRLYRFNYEILMQLDLEERQKKLDETFQGVKKDYDRILQTVH
ncbi:histone acetyltransferase 1 [Steccherinum ochraceum]|uniref:Histone acetyltransferase type B catalytic subunit n=1 Tax=Steccherinum ochraceum TaxID=92696 RepID=A0A4R0R479_9APHY|nr:histone acetyltransferase 1 [Steccherinum ochraceum]